MSVTIRNPLDNPWFVRHSRNGRGAQRLFCFPYAGGNAHIFRPWANLLPASIEVVAIQAPGKGARLLETPYVRLADLIDGLLPHLLPAIAEHPFSFFGHSNGALLAFELACTLQARGLPMPKRLLLSASPAPWTRDIEQPYSSMSVEAFKQVLRDLEGTPAEVLDDPELFDLMLPGLRADFALAEHYRWSHPELLEIPTSIYWAEQDRIDERQIKAWQSRISPAVQFERMPGGHFFIHSHQDLLTAHVAKILTNDNATTLQRT